MSGLVNTSGKYDSRAIMIFAHEVASQYRAKGVPVRTAMNVGLLKAWARAQVIRAEFESARQTPEAKQATEQRNRQILVMTATTLPDCRRREVRLSAAA